MIYGTINANIDLGQILIGTSLLVTAAAGSGLIGRQLKGITNQVNGRKSGETTLSQDIAELNTVVKDIKDTMAEINRKQDTLEGAVLENQTALINHLAQQHLQGEEVIHAKDPEPDQE